MWLIIKLLGVEVFAIGIGLAADDERTRWVDNTGGNFELAPEDDGDEDWEEEYDPEYDNRRPPFGFLHA